MPEKNIYKRRIVCAAIRNKRDGSLILGPRHFDSVMRDAIKESKRMTWNNADQGFIDQQGKFLTREEAYIVATAAGQIIKQVGGDTVNGGTLHSENLY